MHQMVALDACYLWVNIFLRQWKVVLQNAWEATLALPLVVWLPWVLIAALIIYMIMRKWSDPSWRRQRQMKKQVQRQKDEELSDALVDLLTELQVKGVLSASDVNKKLKQFARGCNLPSLFPRFKERSVLSQQELKAALKAKHRNPERKQENAPVTLPDPRQATKRERIRNIFGSFSRRPM
jgi:hypothetical protein